MSRPEIRWPTREQIHNAVKGLRWEATHHAFEWLDEEAVKLITDEVMQCLPEPLVIEVCHHGEYTWDLVSEEQAPPHRSIYQCRGCEGQLLASQIYDHAWVPYGRVPATTNPAVPEREFADALLEVVVAHTQLTKNQVISVSADSEQIEIVYGRHAGTHIERRQTLLATETTELLSDIEIDRLPV